MKEHVTAHGKSSGRTTVPEWQWLYLVGGAAAGITAVIIPTQIIAYVVYPPPTTVRGFFELFQDNALLGLVALDLLLAARCVERSWIIH